MIRCIAMDLDDTLLNDDMTISNENQTAIRKALRKNIKVILASGRMVKSMMPYSKLLGLDLPLIAYNGAVIAEPETGNLLFCNCIPVEESLKLIPIFRSRKVHLNVYINDELYMDELTQWGEKYANDAGVFPHVVKDLKEYITSSPYKMLGIGKINDIEDIQTFLQEEFKTRLDFIRSKPHYLEIVAPGVSKGYAIRKLTKMWGIDKSEVMAIGDAPNDISMISWAGIGVAIGQATNFVKEHADMIVSSNNENGVAEAINKILE